MKITQNQKIELLKRVLEFQNLDKDTIKYLLDCYTNGLCTSKFHVRISSITKYLYNIVIFAETTVEIQNNLSHSINMLKEAKLATTEFTIKTLTP